MTIDQPAPRRRTRFTRRLIVVVFVMLLSWSGWRSYTFRTALSQARALGWLVTHTDPRAVIGKNWKAAFNKETWLDGVTSVQLPANETFGQHSEIIHRLNPRRLTISNFATLLVLSRSKPLDRLRHISLVNCTGQMNLDDPNAFARLQYVSIGSCSEINNVDALRHLPSLKGVTIHNCTGLTSVDGLNGLPSLNYVYITGSTSLTNLDGLQTLPALQWVGFTGCTGLVNVDGIKQFSTLYGVNLTGCKGLTPESVASLKAALPKPKIVTP